LKELKEAILEEEDEKKLENVGKRQRGQIQVQLEFFIIS